jgi:hypothetical protein
MKRTLSVVFAASLAASTVSVAAQEGMPSASRPRFTQEAIRHAVSAAAQDAAQPGRLTSPPVAAAGVETNRSWDTLVGTVKTGRKVIVTLLNSTNVEGNLLAIDTHSMSVEQPGGPQAIEAADVVRVRYAGVRKRHIAHGMLIGMAGGALALVVSDQHSSHPSTKVEAAVLGAIFVGLPFGAIGGAVVPIGQPLYEAANVVRKRCRPGAHPLRRRPIRASASSPEAAGSASPRARVRRSRWRARNTQSQSRTCQLPRRQVHLVERHVPVRIEDLEAALLLLQEPRAIGKQAPLDRLVL